MTSANDQMLLPNIPPPKTEDRDPETLWLGLVTDHRRLFDALQDGWLRPLEPLAGVLLAHLYHCEPQLGGDSSRFRRFSCITC